MREEENAGPKLLCLVWKACWASQAIHQCALDVVQFNLGIRLMEKMMDTNILFCPYYVTI